MDETPAQMIERWNKGYADLEVPPDVQPYGERRAAYIEELNALRAKVGNAPLVNDEVADPKLTEIRRAATEAYLAERREVQRQRRLEDREDD
jgi:hypothetical protein